MRHVVFSEWNGRTQLRFWTPDLIFGAIYLAAILLIGIPYLRFYLG